MRPGDTYGLLVTHGDTTKTRCVTTQVPAHSALARRVTQMTHIRLSTHHVRVRMRTRLRKSCFSVTFASCVTSGDRRATLAQVAAAKREARTIPLDAPRAHAPTWAATARVGPLWVSGQGAAANRYFPALVGRRCRREQPQTPTDLLPVDRPPGRASARGPRRSPTLATPRAAAPSPRSARPSPHGPTWAAVAANHRRPAHPAPAWRHVP